MERTILHADLNNFYASVECLYNPSLRGRPIAVTGNPELRHGIVLAKNDIAKKCGVSTGNPLWIAKQKCSDIVFVEPHYDLYMKYSEIARDIYADYTDKVEPFGLDECWLDVSKSKHLFGNGKTIADKIRERIKFELGVTASVGVSYNKIFAKLGSDLKKPDATTVIESSRFREIVWPLPVKELLYVGRATQNKLYRHGIHTIGELACADLSFLAYHLGKNGVMLWQFANGLDSSPVSNIGAKSLIKSIGNGTTAHRDLISDNDIRITLYVLCESVSARLREYDFICNTVQINIRDNELHWYERQAKLPHPNRTAQALFETAYGLYKQHHTSGKPIRSLGVRACGLSVQEYEQICLLPDISKLQRTEMLELAIDRLRERFGPACIRRGIMLTDNTLSDFNPKDDHIIHPETFFR